MAAWRKESGSCVGRGFDSNGFLGKLKTWIVKVPSSGGPGWYIVDDQSALGTNPYIVVSDKNFPYTNANKHKILQIILPTSTAGVILINAWHFWDASGHTGVGADTWGRYYLRTVDASTFSYDFRGGPEGICLSSRNGSTVDNCLIDEWVGPDDTIVLESNSHTGTTQFQSHIEAGDNNNQLSGYQNITGYGPHLDASGKLYFNIVISGSNHTVNIYKDSARTQLIGHAGPTTSLSNVSITADNSSGLGGTIKFDAHVANDTDIECDYSITLGSGQGANFTVGNYYYLFYFYATALCMAYAKVLGISGDKLILDWIGSNIIPAGGIIEPYPHRFAMFGNYRTTSPGSQWGYLPYYSVQRFELPSFSTNFPRASIMCNALYATTDPDDLQYYRATELLVYESAAGGNNPVGCNRHYGVFKHFFISTQTGMQVFTDGRTFDNGLNYFDISHTSVFGSDAWLVQDSEFNS